MKSTQNVVIKKESHSRGMLSGIFRVLSLYVNQAKCLFVNNLYVEDPRVLRTVKSGMTPNLMGFILRPSSSRSVSMRDIGAAPRSFTARSVIPTLRAATYAGYSGRTGFTLIELLVVVLIIGILAAVAVPQYQKAVERSKTRQAIGLLDSVYNAQQVYYLANGQYATSFDQLDIDIPWAVTYKFWSANAYTARTYGDWNIEIAGNQWGSRMLYVGRNSGPYKGTGFVKYLTGTDTRYTYCVERHSNGMVFDTSNGSYCEKFFNCTPSGSITASCSTPVY